MRALTSLLVLLVAVGCRSKSPEDTSSGAGVTTDSSAAADADGDGYTVADGDCDDSIYALNPGADDIYGDGIDQDCDGADGVDLDGDGFASEASGGTDCDDGDGEVNPGVDDTYGDGVDQDCDGADGVDLDGDGYASEASGGTDCDDDAWSVNPGEEERCGDGLDNDCNGTADDATSADAITWYADADDDGWGSWAYTQESCAQPEGYVDNDSDCDDLNAAVNPDAAEVCNGIDDDCDGDIDDADDGVTFYRDADGDGYGNEAITAEACDVMEGYSDVGGDCDDGDPDAHPDGVELCDGADNDCDGRVDIDALDGDTYYADTDGDGFGDADNTQIGCEANSGYVEDDEDCDDGDGAINPDAGEICNGVDDDCDGEIDDADSSVSGTTTWYADDDSDGYGDAGDTEDTCSRPSGYVADATDCDDGAAGVNPGVAEVCDEGVDNDCDGYADDDDPDVAGASAWYADDDGDGYGDPSSSARSCESATGYVSDSSDCDDSDADINPEGSEVCDDVDADEDCDGSADDDDADATGQSDWYMDSDEDGYGDPDSSVSFCDAPPGYVSDATDCDDGDDLVNVEGEETWYDGIDGDCDGASDYDADGDGYDSDTYGGLDCDDADSDRSPATEETWYDGFDADCDGLSDYDLDGDGYDSATYGGEDCNDYDGEVYPGARETDGAKDNDCDGLLEEIPVSVASYDADLSTLYRCDPIYLDGSGSSDPDGDPLEYLWTMTSQPSSSGLGDEDIIETTDESPTFQPDVSGDYSFSLTVTDDGGNVSDSSELSVSVVSRPTNSGPVPDAGSDSTNSTSSSCTRSGYDWTCDDCSDVEFTLDASSSTDSDGDWMTYEWTLLTGDSYGEIADPYAETTTATIYGISATYGTTNSVSVEVELTVSDCFGTSSTDTVLLTLQCTGS